MMKFFIFDVESIGLHGEGFAVAGGVYQSDGEALSEFCFSFHRAMAFGTDGDRAWVAENVPVMPVTHKLPKDMRDAFWNIWKRAKADGALMAVECGWPVEANFLEQCVCDSSEARNWEGPYPLHEIATFMRAAGMDPMAKYPRLPNELPEHSPLADARLSARLLAMALGKLGIV